MQCFAQARVIFPKETTSKLDLRFGHCEGTWGVETLENLHGFPVQGDNQAEELTKDWKICSDKIGGGGLVGVRWNRADTPPLVRSASRIVFEHEQIENFADGTHFLGQGQHPH